MSDQTVFALSTEASLATDISLPAHDRAILRSLAMTVAGLAARPLEQEKRELWYRHNALLATRPLIFCDPENGWNEIITPEQLQCRSELGRDWEMLLRKEVFWGAEMGDDRVIEPFFNVALAREESDWGMHETKHRTQDDGSYIWDAPLRDYTVDLPRLRFPQITVDSGPTQRIVDLVNEVMGDILPARIKTPWWWTLGMTWTAINLRGLQQFMFDMSDYPDELHRLMAFLRDGHMAKLNYLQENGFLSLNNDGTYVVSGGCGGSRELPQADFTGRVRTQDMWGFAESQETVGVSPAMFEEFVFPYQLPLLERFGLNCYGCCEPLDKRWHIVQRIPRVRRVSVSAWCNLADMAEKLQGNYIFSWKPAPSDLAGTSFDEEAIRSMLRQGMDIGRNCCMEVIMKDNHTIRNDPRRVTRWVQIAREEAER